MKNISRAVFIGLSLVLLVGLMTLPCRAGEGTSEFVGIWKFMDGRNQPFYVTLSADGKAKSEWVKAEDKARGRTGTWKEEEGAADVTWENGWQEVIVKSESGFTKQAFSPKQTRKDKPINTSSASKVDAVPTADVVPAKEAPAKDAPVKE